MVVDVISIAIVLGLKAQVLTKSDVKTPQLLGMELEVVIES